MSSAARAEAMAGKALPRPVPSWVRVLAWLGVAVGAVALAVGLRSSDPAPAWRALLVNFLFWVSLGQGALVWAAVFRVTRTSWSAPVNRVAHSASRFLPVCLLAFAALIAGRRYLLPWLGTEVGDRAFWLNWRSLFLRDGLGLLLLTALSWAFVRTYLRADAGPTEEGAAADRRLSVLGVALLFGYGVVFSLLGFDLVMSLAWGARTELAGGRGPIPWYSTLLGWHFVVSSLYLGIAWLVMLSVLLRDWLGVRDGIATTHLRHLGNLMLAFAMAMTYFLYSQALPIWYENLPPETSFAITRIHHHPWQALCWVLLFTCYLGVFALLVVREMKEKPAALLAVSLVVLASMWLERYMLVVPSLAPRATGFPLLAALIAIGFLGALVLTTARFLARHPAVSPLDLALAKERENWP
ncbi:MAG: hypothetical protein ACE149_09820 [Armatimonadota bacterium]